MNKRGQKRGQFVVSIALLIAVIAMTAALSVYFASMLHHQFRYKSYKEIINTINSDFKRALTNALSRATHEYVNVKLGGEIDLENLTYNYTRLRLTAQEFMDYWKQTVINSYSSMGLEIDLEYRNKLLLKERNENYSGLGIIIPERWLYNLTTAYWFYPESISAIRANLSLNITGIGFYGFKTSELVYLILGVDVKDLKEQAKSGEITHLNVIVLKEGGIPVHDLTTKNFFIRVFDLYTGSWRKVPIIGVSYYGDGYYRIYLPPQKKHGPSPPPSPSPGKTVTTTKTVTVTITKTSSIPIATTTTTVKTTTIIVKETSTETKKETKTTKIITATTTVTPTSPITTVTIISYTTVTSTITRTQTSPVVTTTTLTNTQTKYETTYTETTSYTTTIATASTTYTITTTKTTTTTKTITKTTTTTITLAPKKPPIEPPAVTVTTTTTTYTTETTTVYYTSTQFVTATTTKTDTVKTTVYETTETITQTTTRTIYPTTEYSTTTTITVTQIRTTPLTVYETITRTTTTTVTTTTTSTETLSLISTSTITSTSFFGTTTTTTRTVTQTIYTTTSITITEYVLPLEYSIWFQIVVRDNRGILVEAETYKDIEFKVERHTPSLIGSFRKQITIKAGSEPIPSGYSVSLTFDHASLVSSSKSLPTGSDVRIFYFDPIENRLREIDRVLDEDSSWNSPLTRIWFKTQAFIPA
ncbi:MAG: hypothetical protein QXQ27_07755, partial [Nitrososphaerota archaeon]